MKTKTLMKKSVAIVLMTGCLLGSANTFAWYGYHHWYHWHHYHYYHHYYWHR